MSAGLIARERILSEALAGLMEYDLVNVSGELRPQYVKASIISRSSGRSLFPGTSQRTSIQKDTSSRPV